MEQKIGPGLTAIVAVTQSPQSGLWRPVIMTIQANRGDHIEESSPIFGDEHEFRDRATAEEHGVELSRAFAQKNSSFDLYPAPQ